MNQLRSKFQQFMMGRYGDDHLNHVLVACGFVILLISLILRKIWIGYFADVFMICYLYRSFSKNIVKRSIENQNYREMENLVRRLVKMVKLQWKDREHRYYLCPHCHQMVRVPRGRGKIEISCPSCHTKFSKKS